MLSHYIREIQFSLSKKIFYGYFQTKMMQKNPQTNPVYKERNTAIIQAVTVTIEWGYYDQGSHMWHSHHQQP